MPINMVSLKDSTTLPHAHSWTYKELREKHE
jgi:hypothetical protein